MSRIALPAAVLTVVAGLMSYLATPGGNNVSGHHATGSSWTP